MNDILKETCRSSATIPKAMAEVPWEARDTVLGRERDKTHVGSLSPSRLRFTVVPQTLATWGGVWRQTVFEGATLS